MEERQSRRLDAMLAYSVRMSAWHAHHARQIGEGNMGVGVRMALEGHERRRRMVLPFDEERRKRKRRGG